MTAFPPAFEYLELANRQSLTFVPERFETGEYTFVVAGRVKTVRGYRVWLSQMSGPQMYRVGFSGDLRGNMIGSTHIDIGQSRLTEFLDGFVSGVVPHQTAITLVAVGVRPSLYWQVSARQV